MIDDLANMQPPSILVVGDVMLDIYKWGDVSRISQEAPIPILLEKDEDMRPGGAANVAKNLSSLGAKVTLLAPVGKDNAALILERELMKNHINPVLIKLSYAVTTQKIRFLSSGQQLLRHDIEQKLVWKTKDLILNKFAEIFRKFDIIVISDYNKGACLNSKKMLNLANISNLISIVDPKVLDWKCYKGATIITPNLNEFEKVSLYDKKRSEAENAEKFMQSFNIRNILLTKSQNGMSWHCKQKVFNSNALAKNIYDVTGAGDTVVAVLARFVKYFKNDIDALLSILNCAASISVSNIGTYSVSLEELLEEYLKYKENLHVN